MPGRTLTGVKNYLTQRLYRQGGGGGAGMSDSIN